MALGSPKTKPHELTITKELRKSVSSVDTPLARSSDQRMKKIKKRSIILTNVLFYLFIMLALLIAIGLYWDSHNGLHPPQLPDKSIQQETY